MTTTTIDETRDALRTMRAALNKRRAATSDAAEKQALAEQVDQISDDLIDLANMGAQAAAARITTATASVEALLMTARINPFDVDIRGAFKALADKAVQTAEQASKPFMAGAFIARDSDEADAALDFAPVPIQPKPSQATAASPSPDAPASPAPPVAPASPAGPDDLPPFVRGTTLAALSEDYTLCWAACRITPAKRADVERSAKRLMEGRERYQAVSKRTNGVPWQLIGIMHGLECGYDFFKHLHNGDSLAGPTRRVPAGMPRGWDAARQSWEDSAVDAVQLKNLHKVGAWSLPAALYALEGFNGFGYRSRDVRSPYLWSFSNLYTKGKFIADHQFDANAVSAQVGSALVLKVLEERGAGIASPSKAPAFTSVPPSSTPPRAAEPESGGIGVVRQACEACFDANKGDCSGFVKAVSAKLGIEMDGLANDMVDALRHDKRWTPLKDGVAAARSAKAGNLVIGGLKGSEQVNPDPKHGHVVVVVDGDPAQGAYPHAYWGSLGGRPGKDQTVNFAWVKGDRDRVSYAERPIRTP